MGKYFYKLAVVKYFISKTKANLCMIRIMTSNILKFKLYSLK